MKSPTLDSLTDAGKEELALALFLWKEFKADGKFDPEITVGALKMAQMLGVVAEFETILSKIPPLKITLRV